MKFKLNAKSAKMLANRKAYSNVFENAEDLEAYINKECAYYIKRLKHIKRLELLKTSTVYAKYPVVYPYSKRTKWGVKTDYIKLIVKNITKSYVLLEIVAIDRDLVFYNNDGGFASLTFDYNVMLDYFEHNELATTMCYKFLTY